MVSHANRLLDGNIVTGSSKKLVYTEAPHPTCLASAQALISGRNDHSCCGRASGAMLAKHPPAALPVAGKPVL